jgi:phosphocarrier protein HPr
MTSNKEALQRDLVIVNELGLHARSAAKLAKAAQTAHKGVWMRYGDEHVDAKQVIDLLTLGAAQGARIQIGVESVEDIDTLEKLVEMIASGFGE